MATVNLRSYQTDIISKVLEAWKLGNKNVLVQSHTGSGKTVILTAIVKEMNTATVVMAHRMELVSQLSLALARLEIKHIVVAPNSTIREIVELHMELYGKNYVSPVSSVIVASVDTLIRRNPPWCNKIKLVVVDEAAHVLKDNKWGKAVNMFPSARGLLVTATPIRADGRGLGREAEGVADFLIEGPPMRELISKGYLSPYRIFAPPNTLDLRPVKVTASGEYSPDPLKKAVDKAKITGDVVSHYKKHSNGLGITFAVSVDAAHELAAAYESEGIPALCIHADIGISERASIMKRFRNGIIKQLVNVDILGEGVDVPSVNCVSLVRPTNSYGLHMQQIGRALRPAPGKNHAVILDHVGNVIRHGMPDAPRVWTLDSRSRKSRGSSGAIPLRTCLNLTCFSVFERNLDCCPYCGHPIPQPKERSTPEHVDGDLSELMPEVFKELQDEIKRVDGAPRIPHGVSTIVASSIVKKHHARQEAQKILRGAIADWAGVWHAKGESDSEILRRFWFEFGIDTLTAQTLGTPEAMMLKDKIC